MPEYQSLADLRAALSATDATARTDAYSVVLTETDVRPEQVLGEDPPRDALEAAGIIPESDDEKYPKAAETRQRMVELLEQIAANTEGA